MFDLRALNNTAWLMEPNWIKRAAARLQQFPSCPTSREIAAEHMRRMDIAKNAATTAVRGVKGKVGVIPVYGPVEQRVTAEMMKLGGTSVEEITVSLNAMLRDKSVEAIVMEFDSPGGSSYGIEELSDKIYSAREQKRIFGAVNSLAASAAYWLASATSNLSATPGADVGSVGVFAVHVDETKALEAEGMTVNLVTAGKYKGEYLPITPMTAESRENLQFQVNVTYDKFLSALKRNRNTTLDDVKKNYGQGRVMNADQAKAAGMVDSVRTFEELIGQLMGSSSQSRSAAETAVLRMRHEHRKRLYA